MRNLCRTVLGFALLVTSGMSAANHWTEWSKVELVYPYSTGDILYRFVGQHDDPSGNDFGCSGSYYFVLPANGNNFDASHSTLLAALHGSREVRVHLDSCGAGGWPKIGLVMSR